MAPADTQEGQVILGEGTEGKTLPSQSENQPAGTQGTAQHPQGTDEPKFVFHTGSENSGKSGINLDFPPRTSAKERFSSQVRSITDREAARRQPPAATAQES